MIVIEVAAGISAVVLFVAAVLDVIERRTRLTRPGSVGWRDPAG